jgi:hypothetical protein
MREYKVKNPLAPHQTIIAVTCDTMENLPDGRVSGLTVNKISKIFSVKGKDYETCQKNLLEFLKKLDNQPLQS